MKLWTRLLTGVISTVAAIACTSLTPIRITPPVPPAPGEAPAYLPPPGMPSARGQTGTPVKGENRRIIEQYQNYFIGFAEFDDQGWAYSNGQQIEVIKKRIDAEIDDPLNTGKDFLVLVFVHGWHHNAHDNDGNVQEFRKMVDIAANGLEDGIKYHYLKTQRRVIGIYVGWRGESVNAPPFNYMTVFDRRNAAERVAQGAVRQLFANLRIQQLTTQGVFGEQCPKAARMRTVVIGHSFGGLIAYSALAQAELNELTLAQTTKLDRCNDDGGQMQGGHLAPLWPDGLILINPAFEATRYESFDRLMKSAKVTPASENAPTAEKPKFLTVPHFIVVASETDHWTGRYFSTGRAATTLFEGYDRTDPEATRAERAANLHSIAYVDAYRTHTLDLESTRPDARAVAHLVPWMADKPGLESPVWVVMAADTVVHGHDGFLYGRGFDKKDPQPYLANWLIQLFDKDCTAAPEMAGCLP